MEQILYFINGASAALGLISILFAMFALADARNSQARVTSLESGMAGLKTRLERLENKDTSSQGRIRPNSDEKNTEVSK